MLRFLLAGLLSVVAAQAAARQSPGSPGMEQWLREHAQVLADFRAEAGYVESDAGDHFHFLDAAKRRVILVTKAEHPAHPAVVASWLVEKDGGLSMAPNGVGQGDQAALKAWTDSLHPLDPMLAKALMEQAEQARLLDRFRARAGIVETDAGDHVRLFERDPARVLLFTKPGHPAHPAVVTRKVLDKDGHLFVATDGIGTGNRAALEAWVDSIGAHDADLSRLIQGATK